MQRTILLIDDSPEVQTRLRIVLEKAGYRFLSASNGNEGLDTAIRMHPDLIILDYMMPGKNGIETYQDLREKQDLLTVPVVMLTAFSQSSEQVKQLLEAGLNTYLEKPFGNKELVNIIQNVFLTSDIDARNRELKRAVENSRNFLENLVDSCPVIIMTTDVEGRITSANKAFYQLLDFHPENVLGNAITAILKDKENKVEEGINRIPSTAFVELSEVWVMGRDSKRIPLELKLSLLKDRNGSCTGILAVGQDLSDRKRLQDEIVEKERLAAITESMATMNHEINNPLTPIIGNIQLLRNDNNMASTHSEKLAVIESNAKRISEIIRKFNEISTPVKKQYYGRASTLEF